jgi:hypothetical protein
MAIIVLIWRENDTADKVPRANHGFKNGLFLTKLGTKMISLFAIYTIIGTNTRSNPCCRHGWPSLYLFEGKTTQLTKRHAPIVHSKMDFSQRIWEQKWPVFLQCTQCNDPGETVHTWWRGEGFPGAARVLVGVAMVMINFHVELCVESYVFHPGTGLGKGAFPQTGTKMKRIENAVDKTFFKLLTWAALKKLCPRGWAPGFWTLKHDSSFEELKT